MHPLDLHAVLRLELLNTHGTEIAPRSDVVGENLHRDGLGHNASCPWKVRFLDADGSMPQNARRVPARFGFPGFAAAKKLPGLEDHGDDALLDGALDDARVVREETQHAVILTEHVRTEAGESALDAGADQLVEEHRAKPLALIAVFEEESHLAHRLVTRRLVAPDADELHAGHR